MGLGNPIQVFRSIFNVCTLQRFNPDRAKAVTTSNVVSNQTADPSATTTATQQQEGAGSSSTATGSTSSAPSSSRAPALRRSNCTIGDDVTEDASTSASKAAGSGKGSHPSVAHPPADIGGSSGCPVGGCVTGPRPDPCEVATSHGSSTDAADGGAPDGNANPAAPGCSSNNLEQSVSPEDDSGFTGHRWWEGYGLEDIMREQVAVAKKKTQFLIKLIAKRVSHLAIWPCRITYALMRAGLICATAVIAWVQSIKVTYPMKGAILIAVIMYFLDSIRGASL